MTVARVVVRLRYFGDSRVARSLLNGLLGDMSLSIGNDEIADLLEIDVHAAFSLVCVRFGADQASSGRRKAEGVIDTRPVGALRQLFVK